MYYYQNGTFIKFASNDYNITQSMASGVMEVMDFDGDGKMELAVSTGQHLNIYKFETSDESFNIVASIDIDGGFIASGDFNGDGISDILYRNGYYYIALGNGKTFSPVSTTVAFNHYMSNYNISPAVLDINNDGYDDVITFNNQSGDMKAICYLCCGYYDNKISFQNPIPVVSSPVVLTQTELEHQYSFTFGDFNNDHHVDLVASKNYNTLYDGMLIYEFKMDKRVPQVQNVTVGDGSFVRWMYHDIFGLHYRYASHISILPYKYNVVESMTKSLGTTAQTNTLRYSFERPTYSFKRQQRMGFLVTSVTDGNRHATDSLFSEIMTGENHVVQDLIMPVRQKTYVYGQLFRSVGYMPLCLTFSNNQRRYPFVCQTNDTNCLDMTVTKTLELRLPYGRKTNEQQTVKNANDFYPQFTTQTDYHYTTHALSSGGVITTIDSIKRNSRMNNSSIKSVQKQYFTYNNRYLPEQFTIVMDGVTTSRTIQNYDDYGNGRLVTDSGDSCLAKSTTLSFDNTGRFCVYESSGSYFNISRTFSPQKGLLLSVTNENDLTTTYTYDVFDKLTAVHHPDGNTDTIRYGWYGYDEIPNAKYYSLTRMPGKSFDTERYYDLLGRNICTRENGFFTDTCYDIKGNVYRVSAPYIRGTSDANKIWHTFQYDQFGRTTSEVGPYSNVSYQYTGYTTTVTDNLRQTVSTRTTDAVGRVISVTDPGGTITFNYSHVLHNGRTATQTNVTACGHTSQIIADASGNRLRIVDPNAGAVTCRFNAHNQPLQQTDANGNNIRFQYDEWGRLTSKTNITPSNIISEVFRYTYDHYTSSNRGKGKLYRVLRNDTLCEQYTYDALSRPAKRIRYIDGTAFQESYTYNAYGQLATLTYPDGFATRFTYNGKGQLSQIDQGSNSSLIFLAQSYNLYGQPLKCRFGNGTATEYEYNSSGLLTRINTGKMAGSTPVKPPLVLMNTMSLNTLNTVPDVIIDDEIYTVDSSIQNFHYTYDNKGRLVQRDQKNSQYETFQYDNLDRLTSFAQGTLSGTSQTLTTTYDGQGNILSNTMVGTYSYGSDKPHAVTEVTPNDTFPDAISAANCITEYNAFNQPSRIEEGDEEILLEYGADGQRVKAVFKYHGHLVRTRYYISANYEKEVEAGGVTTHYNYVYGVNGLAAICVRRNNADSMYYVHPDRLGSYTHITNSGKQVVRALHFDPWGNVKTDADWTVFAEGEPGHLAETFRFDRGFTGHEHYAGLKVINMNGRLYDPVIARFFSPDNFVQAPEFTQSYNRYSYCLNNPLQYTDPSGEEMFTPWYRDIFGYVQWADFGDQIPLSGTFLGFEGVFTSNGEMRYYYADGRVSNLKLPQVFIDRGNPADFTFSFSSLPMRGAGFYRIGDPSEQTGSFSTNFQQKAPINPGYINGLNAYGVANGAKTNLIEAAVRYNFSDNQMWHQFRGLDKAERALRYEKALGKTVGGYLKIASKTNVIVGVASVSISFYNGWAYYRNGGQDWQVYAKIGLDIAMTGIGFLGPVGFAISSTYFIIDISTRGFGGFGEIR